MIGIKTNERIARIVMWSLIAVLTALTLFLLSLALTFATGGDAPKVFGKNVFLVETDAFSLLKNGTAVVTEEVAPEEITAGNIVIFELADAPRLGEIQSSSMSEGIYSFEVLDENAAPSTVSQGQIIGKAMMFSDFLGGAIVFVRSPVGLLVIAVLPCMIIIGIELFKAINTRRNKPSVAPVKKQDEIPTYVPKPKLQPAAANAYRAAQQAAPAEPAQKKDDSPLFVSPMNRRRAEAPTVATPLSQERLNAAIAATNAERQKRERLKTQLESAAATKRSATAAFEKPKPVGTESRSYRTIIDEKPGSADAVKIKKGPDDGDPTVKQYTPKLPRSQRSLSTTATIPRLDEILADENENKRYNVDDILEKYGNVKKS